MKRREFITLLGGAAAVWPIVARAQKPAKVWRVGMLDTTAATLNAANVDAFRKAMHQLGYIEGQNLILEYRSGDGHIERFPHLAAELVRLNVDIIVTRGTPAALAAKSATATIPIVMAAIGEPVETRMVASLARPGGNVTGLSAFVTELTGKRVEIIRELIPQVSRIALVDNMANRSVPAQWDETKRAALALGIQSQLYDVRTAEDIERAFSSAIAQQVNALSVGNDSVVIANRVRVAELSAKHRLPTIYATREFVEVGGLLSYAAHYPDLYRRAAAYVDRIFKGTNPADLPVEQPTKFELVVNLKTARTLGLEVPPSLLARADEVMD